MYLAMVSIMRAMPTPVTAETATTGTMAPSFMPLWKPASTSS